MGIFYKDQTYLEYYTNLIYSIIFLLIISFIAEVIRRKIIPYFFDIPNENENERDTGFIAANELLCGVELVSHSLEYGIIAETYGMTHYAVVVVLFDIWYFHSWDESTICNPVGHFIKFVEGRSSFLKFIEMVLVDLIGGMMAWYLLIKPYWKLGVSTHHTRRLRHRCETDIQVEAWPFGFMVEALGTLLDVIFCKIGDEIDLPYQSIFNPLFSIGLVLAAWDYTGGWYSPALVSTVLFNCEGSTLSEFILVYWLGPLTGGFMALSYFYHDIMYEILFGYPTPNPTPEPTPEETDDHPHQD